MSYATEVAAAISGEPHDWTEETRRRLIAATVSVNPAWPLPQLWQRYFREQAIGNGLTLTDQFALFSDYPFAYAALALPDA